ncbi:MAG: dihydrolipoyl dehydrogenase family protein, partial [Planctomycetota bacterium]
MYDYDVVVIGAGSAGLVACKLANGLGKKTALIEKRKLGGDCTWFGCIPSKTLIKSAYIAHQMTRLQQFGLVPTNPVELNAKKVMSHVRAVVEADAAGHPAQSYEDEGINVFFGQPQFLDDHQIQIDSKTITSKNFVICTGSSPLIPYTDGLGDVPFLTNETIFDLETLPESMLVLGAGPIGIELSAALNRLGVNVTVLLRSGQILKKEDTELSNRLMEILQAEGLNVLANTKTKSFSQKNGKIIASVENQQGQTQLQAESLLVAIGRKPNTQNMSLEKAGVEFNTKGIVVDKHLRT